MNQRVNTPGSSCREQGTVLVLALVFLVFAVGLVLTGTDTMKSSLDRTTVGLNVNGHAGQFARAGLIESIRWFRQQPTQPVTVFAPVRDTSVSPAIVETEEPDIGLVRQFRVDGRIWGRYEIWKQWDDDPNEERRAFRQLVQVEDVSLRRDMESAGGTWRLKCVAYLFDRVDENVAYDQQPNRVLGVEILETEISRLFIKPPGMAAINAGDPSVVNLGAATKVNGGDVAVSLYHRDDPAKNGLLVSQAELRGIGSISRGTNYDDSVRAVFGVKDKMLRSMASLVVVDAAKFPRAVPTNGIVVVEAPTLVFDSDRPLRGNGLLYVDGDVDVRPGSSSFFSGLVYATGDVQLAAPAEFRGTIIAKRGMSTTGTGDFVRIDYDQAVLDSLQREIATYRVSRAIRRAKIHRPDSAASHGGNVAGSTSGLGEVLDPPAQPGGAAGSPGGLGEVSDPPAQPGGVFASPGGLGEPSDPPAQPGGAAPQQVEGGEPTNSPPPENSGEEPVVSTKAVAEPKKKDKKKDKKAKKKGKKKSGKGGGKKGGKG